MKPVLLSKEENVFNDNIAFVQHWDFSKGNIDEQSRIDHITTVASICYDNPNVVGKETLYNRLKAEAMGLPSSSFEFIPVLINLDILNQIDKAYKKSIGFETPHVRKYGQIICDTKTDEKYLLSNYRAVLFDFDLLTEKKSDIEIDITQIYNTEYECNIIKENSNTFLYKMDISTSKQHNRHRVSLQELSRRYVSGKKTKFEFYHSNNLKNIESAIRYENEFDDESFDITYDTKYLTNLMINHYFKAINSGVKPQEARRILPQSMYTTIWSTFLPFQLDNYLNLRDDHHAQDEIRWIAQAMKRCLNITYDS